MAVPFVALTTVSCSPSAVLAPLILTIHSGHAWLYFIAFDSAVVVTSADVLCGAGSHFSGVQHCVPGYLTRLLPPLSCGSYFRPCEPAFFAM